MKWLVILSLLFATAMFVAVRFRRHIQTASYMWKLFRQMQQSSRTTEKQIPKKQKALDEVALVKCAKCGTWMTESNAFKLPSKIYYCSAACMESAVLAN